MKEMLGTLHVHEEEVPFISTSGDVETRLIHARRGEFVVSELRARPGAILALHRHATPVFSFTSEGRWGHDTTFEYRPGTYVFETPGVVHRFMNGPATSRAFFISTGDLEWIDEESGDVLGAISVDRRIDQYLQSCEEAGLPRPNILA
jgi:2,4'-dihydroxyacetophenone dioxygenase